MNKPTKSFSHYSCLFCIGYISCFILAPSFHGIEISPSKYQGGSSNNVPYQTTTDTPSLLKNPFKWVFGDGRSEAMKRVNAPPNLKVDLVIEPKNFTPSTHSTFKARMIVTNQSKEKYILEFTSAQHYDFFIKNKDGKEMYRFSSDKAYSQQFSSTLINQNDKLVYEEELFSTANQALDLPAGDYKLIGQITSKIPISVETSFQVSP